MEDLVHILCHHASASWHDYGSHTSPSSTILVAPSVSQPTPMYACWLWVDQLLRAWIFATISKETLREVCNIPHALPIWQHLASNCNTASLGRALDLKCMLTNVSKGSDQSMEDYLHHIKTFIDFLAAIQSPGFYLKLIQFTTFGLLPNYHTFVITYSMLPGSHTFDGLWPKLIFYEQRPNFQSNRDTLMH